MLDRYDKAQAENKKLLDKCQRLDEDLQKLKVDHEILKDRYQRLEVDHQQLNVDHEQLKMEHQQLKIVVYRHNTHLVPDIELIRSAILDCPQRERDVAPRNPSRNAAAHGGNMIADIDIIRCKQNIDNQDRQRLECRYSSFEYLYFLPFESSHDHILRLETETRVIKLLNIRGNMATTAPWDRQSYLKIREKLEKVLVDWRREEFDIDFWKRPAVVTKLKDWIVWSDSLAHE